MSFSEEIFHLLPWKNAGGTSADGRNVHADDAGRTGNSDSLIWKVTDFGRFTNPFRYAPHEAVVQAAGELMAYIDTSAELSEVFAEGKMLGVLVVENSGTISMSRDEAGSGDCPAMQIGYLAAFSGNAGGKSCLDGFVPPIFNLAKPDGEYRRREAEISSLNHEISDVLSSDKYIAIHETVTELQKESEREISAFKAHIALNKLRRDRLRSEAADGDDLSALVNESQREKADLRRLKQFYADRISMAERVMKDYDDRISELRLRRSCMSEDLQKWIFRQYVVHNALGQTYDIAEIFACNGLVPPGGTGECAAPKLLEYAYRHGLKPLAMGEFWYGKSPDTAVRNHGAFYPSCTSKCGPLLGFMLQGLDVENTLCCNLPGKAGGLDEKGKKADAHKNNSGYPTPIEVIYEDGEIIVVNKPAGMLSVPGLLQGELSVKEILGRDRDAVLEVHRLDMDTSGILVFAKNKKAEASLRAQFEMQGVVKTYVALLDTDKNLQEEGSVSLPVAPDYDERPRQKVDFTLGKTAVTRYKVLSREPGRVRVALYPQTGRTHQLRVHCAHHLGLGSPILGDKLYGSPSAARLYLHALSIRFRHPSDGRLLCLSCPADF